MKKTILLITLMASLTFGQTQPEKIKMLHSANAMKQELEKRIPVGSSITDAQRLLQANGFRCTIKQQQSFIELNDDELSDNKSVVEHGNIDFLFCDKRDDLLTNTRFWQAAVVHKNGVVSELLSSVDKSPVLRKKDYIRMSDADIKNLLLKFAPLGSSEDEVKRMLREVFHRGYKKDSGSEGKDPCPDCSKAQVGFLLQADLQQYDRLRNLFLAGYYVWAEWYFDEHGILKGLKVTHQWDGV